MLYWLIVVSWLLMAGYSFSTEVNKIWPAEKILSVEPGRAKANMLRCALKLKPYRKAESADLKGKQYQLSVLKGQTLLQAMKAAEIEVSYSCESGVCGTCVAKLTSGKTEMKSCMALEDKNIKKGQILTCQALATSSNIQLQY